jgi:hypothetical protein
MLAVPPEALVKATTQQEQNLNNNGLADATEHHWMISLEVFFPQITQSTDQEQLCLLTGCSLILIGCLTRQTLRGIELAANEQEILRCKIGCFHRSEV